MQATKSAIGAVYVLVLSERLAGGLRFEPIVPRARRNLYLHLDPWTLTNSARHCDRGSSLDSIIISVQQWRELRDSRASHGTQG
jgi:acetyl-CoA carboxylase alpha subunit